MDMGKLATLLLIAVLMVSSLILVESTYAATSKPSIPEYTVKLVDRSYTVPLTYTNSTNPYTGQQETSTQGGYHVENKTIDVTIKNQPFTPTNIDGNITQLFYVIRWKGHFENWAESAFSTADFYYYLNNVGTPASNSDYTVKTYTLASFGNIPEDGQVDFQVKAQVGYSFLYYGQHAHIQPIGTNFQLVEESGWSSIQTVNISGNSFSPIPTTSPSQSTPAPTIQPPQSTPNPTAPATSIQNPLATEEPSFVQTGILLGLDWERVVLIVMAAAIVVMAVGMVVLWRKVAAK
jgi:hypothetical protein